MLDARKTAAFIASKRKEKGLTQQQVAEQLRVSFQAVSKWENGLAFPGIDVFYGLSKLLDTTIDEMLRASDEGESGYSYSKAGVDITYTDKIKKDMQPYVAAGSNRVLSRWGDFAALYDIRFEHIEHPVLVLKAEEPGSKQKLASQYGYTESICHDMINHLVNDIIVMGATPLAVLDTIVCTNPEKETIKTLVRGISQACIQNECALVGGETSVQPGVLEHGQYVLTASVTGIVDKSAIIDGSRIRAGDCVLALASNGLHTNGYSLVRMMLDHMPDLKDQRVGERTFLETVMIPHAAYYPALKPLLQDRALHGMAHITGGGIVGNLTRILHGGLGAHIDLSLIKIPDIFRHIKAAGSIAQAEMLRTFNCGVGMILVVDRGEADRICGTISPYYDCYRIGAIEPGDSGVVLANALPW